MAMKSMTKEQIQDRLDAYLEVEFSYRKTDALSIMLAEQPADRQMFIIDWVKRIASTNIEIAYQFAIHSIQALELMDDHMVEAWVLQAMDVYDRSGLHPAIKAIKEIDLFVRQGRERASGCVYEEQIGVLLPFVHGLSGRKLKLAQADELYTDSEVIFLPAVMAHLPDKRDNFLLYKAAVVHHWAQVRFGTFRIDIETYLQNHPKPDKALRCFHALEITRLDACIRRELPGFYREMQMLKDKLQGQPAPAGWGGLTEQLHSRQALAQDSLDLVNMALSMQIPEVSCYQGQLNPSAVAEVMAKRISREKASLRVALKLIADEINEEKADNEARLERFEAVKEPNPEFPEGFKIELQVNGKSAPIPDGVKATMTSILLDLGDVPNDYLVPAGPGEYDLSEFEEKTLKPEEVWSGAYHEEGAHIYKEWDYRRKHYRKDWCVLREMSVKPEYDGFVDQVLAKHRRLIINLRKTFEALRDEDRLLKRQVHGDGVDIDAFVEAWADVHTGLEMTDRLFTRMHRDERNIAVMFMVDMSGSTQGWVNQAEREALVLLAESLETLGDRYAIYGFTGMSRKRCEVFPVKKFDQPYDDEVKARISGIRAGDYTRMGAAIRHLSQRLVEVEARTKLLITLSDGKPDDYLGDYRGEYGIEDTRQALFEARRDGIHAFCITIDEEGQEYLPHMYGAANYTVISEVEKLPLKVSDIYKKITT
jgi:nitric oxide reductase NorD protein